MECLHFQTFCMVDPIFLHFFSTSISDMISDLKTLPKRAQNGGKMRPKFLTKRLLGALGPPLLHQGLPKGPRASKNDRFRPQNDHEIQEKSNTKEKKQTRHNDNDKKETEKKQSCCRATFSRGRRCHAEGVLNK